jgi:hypothetical protein
MKKIVKLILILILVFSILGLLNFMHIFPFPGILSGLIFNSEGESWMPTTDNIQIAIDSTEEGGIITLPSIVYDLTDSIVVKKGRTLDMNGATFKPVSTGFHAVILEEASGLWNGKIDCTSIEIGDYAAVRVAPFDEGLSHPTVTIDNMVLMSHNHQGKGIYLLADIDMKHISWVIITRVYFHGFEYGMKLYADTPPEGLSGYGCFVNGNQAQYVYMNQCQYMIHCDDNREDVPTGRISECAGNQFNMGQFEPSYYKWGGYGLTEIGFYSDGGANRFHNMFLWDFQMRMREFGKKSVYLDDDSWGNSVSWTGGPGTWNPDDWVDLGTNNYVYRLGEEYPSDDFPKLDEFMLIEQGYNTVSIVQILFVIALSFLIGIIVMYKGKEQWGKNE